MSGYLRRLARTGAAYTASSVLSKLIALFLLPVYTAYLTPSDYGAAEVMLAAVIAASIVVRFGVIEALLRFYYLSGESPERVVSSSFAVLFWSATAFAAVGLAFAEPLSAALLDRSEPELARLAVLGLWTLTLWEYALTLLRLDERARAYFAITVVNVIVTIPFTVWLVAGERLGAEGILLGTFATGALFLALRLYEERRRLALIPDPALVRRMLRFGLPTMPAELTLYSLNFIDRILIVRLAGLAEAGLYALAIKFAQAMNVIARGFQLAFPPLAYSIADDDDARRAYSLVLTWFAALCAFTVAGLWLLARWIVELLAAPEFLEAHEAVGPLAAGVALYALYLILVVVLGRTGRTEFSFPATVAGTVVNIALNLVLIPPLGIVGAALALIASYAVVLVVMYVLTQRLFPVAYEWGRLATLLALTAATVAVGELLLPADGLGGLASRTALWLALPGVLLVSGFLSEEERAGVRAVLGRMRGGAPPEPEQGIASGSGLGKGSERAARAETAFEQGQRDRDSL